MGPGLFLPFMNGKLQKITRNHKKNNMRFIYQIILIQIYLKYKLSQLSQDQNKVNYPKEILNIYRQLQKYIFFFGSFLQIGFEFGRNNVYQVRGFYIDPIVFPYRFPIMNCSILPGSLLFPPSKNKKLFGIMNDSSVIMIGQVFSYRFDQSFISIIKSKQTFELTKHLHHRKKKRIYADYKSNQKRYRTMLVAKLTQGGHFGLTQPTISDRKASESRGIIIIRYAQEQEGNQWRFQAPICQNMSEGSSVHIQKRKMLVKMVQEEGLSIVASVKRLKIKLTTARLILQKYRKNGTFPMRKFKKVGKMLLDLPNDVKKEQNQLLVKQQHNEEHLIKEEFSGEESEASEDSISAEDLLPQQSLDDVKIEE